jgi:carbonic anhydrase/acetyltransferase-like protein (isoleucine patch superfamily)
MSTTSSVLESGSATIHGSARAILLPRCRRIGIGSVVGAGSVVTSDVPDFTIVVGNPARAIGERLSIDERNRIMAIRPWELEPVEAERALEAIRHSEPGTREKG